MTLYIILLIIIITQTFAIYIYVKDNPYEVVKVSDIRIKQDFRKTGVGRKKMSRKEAFYLENGYFEDRIILDKDNVLLDGFSTFLLAHAYDVDKILIVRDKNK